ncbi:MAG: MFS transporter [Patescibacteria group bacterium]|nr:MFS transporter [Patescibacteria group bacterium]
MQLVRDEELAVLSTANFFSRYHYYLIAFVTSTFLAGFLSTITLGWVIAGISTAITLSLAVMPKIFDRAGTRRILVLLGLLEISIVIALTLVASAAPAAVLLALQGMCSYNIFLGLDLLLQAHTTDEHKTGHFRGLFLALTNTSVLAATFTISVVLHDHNFAEVFLMAAAAAVPFTLLAASLPSISHVAGMHTSFKMHTFREIWNRPSLLTTMCAHFLLLVFFAWMMFYLPLYFYTAIGLSATWTFLLMTLSLLPYMLIEYPIGVIADNYIGEKEMALGGYVIMILGTAFIAYVNGTALLPWIAVVLFGNVGGAMVEVTTETHFFKHVAVTDSNIISVFRMLRPLAAILAPALASLALFFVSFQNLFLVFGVILCCGIPFVLAMHDTK